MAFRQEDYSTVQEFGTVALSDSVVLHVVETKYGERLRIELKPYITSQKYEGWGKAIVIPIESFERVAEVLNSVKEKLKLSGSGQDDADF